MKSFSEFLNEKNTTTSKNAVLAKYTEDVKFDIQIAASKHSLERKASREIQEDEIILSIREAGKDIIEKLVSNDADVGKTNIVIYNKRQNLVIPIVAHSIKENSLRIDVITVYRANEKTLEMMKKDNVRKTWKLIEIDKDL